MGPIRSTIEMAALSIECLAVAVILIATMHGSISFVGIVAHAEPELFARLVVLPDRAAGRPRELVRSGDDGLEHGLEVERRAEGAADIIRTVALEPTLPNVMILAVLVVVRTFLSWSLVVEMEGHWPWKG